MFPNQKKKKASELGVLTQNFSNDTTDTLAEGETLKISLMTENVK